AMMLGLIPQGLAEAAITASLPDMAHDLGRHGELAAQMMLGMSALGLVMGALASGRILEWAGTRRAFLGALLAFALGGGVGVATGDLALLYAGRVVVGFAASCIATTCLWRINARYTGDGRAKFFGGAGATGGIATILSVLAGGALTQHFGWRMCLLIYPGFAALALPIVLAGMDQQRPLPRRPRADGASTGYLAALLPLYGLVLLFYGLIGMASMQLPFLLELNGAHGAGDRALIQGLPGLTSIAGASFFGLVQHRFGATRSFTASLGLFVAGLLLFATARTGLVLPAIGAGAIGLCMGLSGPYFYHIIAQRTEVALAGRYLGYLNAFTFLGVFASPMVTAAIKPHTGLAGLFVGGAAMVAGMALVIGRASAGPAPRALSTPLA
ncbi:MAG TPA: MFS transporter, partial [Novosphingobium sp.]|nr:MFS transporter [Novosphingobium sp.]